MASYSVPSQSHQVEEVIKGSRFITRSVVAETVEEAKAFLRSLREAEPDATHHCWAHIVGDPNCTTLLGCSDDGEPAGTAGKPMLNVLQHSGVGDIMVVCTRYYGGTKLGTGGLARAYGGGVKLLMESLPVQQKIATVKGTIKAPYECVKDIEHELKAVDGSVTDTQYSESVELSVVFPEEHKQTIIDQLTIRFGEKLQWNFTP